MPAPLLSTKLYIPPPRSKAVSRPHLIARLNAILEKLSAWADERAAIGALIQACHDKIEKGRYDAQSLKMRLRPIYIRVAAQARIVENDRLPADDDLPEEPSAIVGAKPEKP